MKVLIVGGKGQGKAAYIRRHYPAGPWLNGADCPIGASPAGAVLDRLHLLIRRLLEAGITPADRLAAWLGGRLDWIILCDEIGCGVIPADPFERLWREETGRICCRLAEEADVVIRMVCGLPQKLKDAR